MHNTASEIYQGKGTKETVSGLDSGWTAYTIIIECGRMGGMLVKRILEILVVIVQRLGYWGIFASTGLEYACFPVSSEILLPFIGYTVSKGEMHLIGTIFISTIGGVLGCIFCYAVGLFGCNFIEKTLCRRCKGIALGIQRSKAYFQRYGRQSVFWGRVFPIVRTYISFPAGMAKMAFLPFVGYSAAGALLWNTVLITIGYLLGENWNLVSNFFTLHKNFITVFSILLIGGIFFLVKGRKCRKN